MAQNKPKYKRHGEAAGKAAALPWYQRAWYAVRDFFAARSPKQLILGAVALLAAAALICGFVYLITPHPLKFTLGANGTLVDSENNVTYRLAPSVFEPIAVKTARKYAKASDGTILYLFGEKGKDGLDPLKWLSEKYDGTAAIWYASTEQLPSFSEFKGTGILVCMDTGVIVQQKNTILSKTDVAAVIDAMLEGEATEVPACETIYRLRFVSDTYPGLYYCLSYLQDTDQNYLYDRSTGKGVSVGSLLLHYIPRDDMKEDENTLGYVPSAETTTAAVTSPVTAAETVGDTDGDTSGEPK